MIEFDQKEQGLVPDNQGVMAVPRSGRWFNVVGICFFLVLVVMTFKIWYDGTYLREQTMPQVFSSREAASSNTYTVPGKDISGEPANGISFVVNPDEWEAGDVPRHLLNTRYDDPDLLKHLRENWILPPSDKPRRLVHPETQHYSQEGQSRLVDALLKKKTNGFFIECGTGDGEKLSNSLFFEKSRNWTGLLIEPNPTIFSDLRKKNRHSYQVNACVSPTGRVNVLNFTLANLVGGLTDFMETAHKRSILKNKRVTGVVQVPCFPIRSLLLSIGVSHIDYFSLDVEGPEMNILRSFPFDDVTVDVLSIEVYVKVCKKCTLAKMKRVREFFRRLGKYREIKKKVKNSLDMVFARTSLWS